MPRKRSRRRKRKMRTRSKDRNGNNNNPVRDNLGTFPSDSSAKEPSPSISNGGTKRKGTHIESSKASKIRKPNGHKSIRNGHSSKLNGLKSNGLMNGRHYITDDQSSYSGRSLPNSTIFHDDSSFVSHSQRSRISHFSRSHSQSQSRFSRAKSDDERSRLTKRSKSRSHSPPEDSHLSQQSNISDKMNEAQDQLAMISVEPPPPPITRKSSSTSNRYKTSMTMNGHSNTALHSMNGHAKKSTNGHVKRIPMSKSSSMTSIRSSHSQSKSQSSTHRRDRLLQNGMNTLEFRNRANRELHKTRNKLRSKYSSLQSLPTPSSPHRPNGRKKVQPYNSVRKSRRKVWNTKPRLRHRQIRPQRVYLGALDALPLKHTKSMARNGNVDPGTMEVSNMKKELYRDILRSKSEQVGEHLCHDLANFVKNTHRINGSKDISRIDLTKEVEDFISEPGDDDQSDIEILNLDTKSPFRVYSSLIASRNKFDRYHDDDVMNAQRFGMDFNAKGPQTQRILKDIEERIRREKEEAERQRQMEIEKQNARSFADRVSVKFNPLTEEDEDQIDEVMSLPSNQVVATHKASNLEVRVRDLNTLEPGKWLNDEVMNFYISLLQDRNNKRVKSDMRHIRVLFMNTFFFTKLATDGHKSVKRWTRKGKLKKKGLEGVNTIFELDKVIFPVHVNGVHWCCGCINIKEKRLEYYDSMSGSAFTFFTKTQQYLKEEIEDKLKGLQASKMMGTLGEWTHLDNRDTYPQQENGYDCGVFSSKCADWISDGLVPKYSQQNMGYFRRRMMLEIIRRKTRD